MAGKAPMVSDAASLRRWLALTRADLPGMAAAQRWPIRLDHCFMRVCLDAALGQPWHAVVRRPAVRHPSDEQPARALAMVEGVGRRARNAARAEHGLVADAWQGRAGASHPVMDRH